MTDETPAPGHSPSRRTVLKMAGLAAAAGTPVFINLAAAQTVKENAKTSSPSHLNTYTTKPDG
ncbi:MAG: twin-arginine translocation signal domain-containing protein, partial [Acetobacter persici]